MPLQASLCFWVFPRPPPQSERRFWGTGRACLLSQPTRLLSRLTPADPQVTLAGLEPLGSTPSLRELVPLCWGNPGIALAISWASFRSCLCQRLAL